MLRSQARVGQPGCAQSHDLAEGAYRLGRSLLLLLLLLLIVVFLFVLAAVALVRCAVASGAAASPGLVAPRHALDELLQPWAQLALLAVVQPPVQSSVDGHAQGLDQLRKDEEAATPRLRLATGATALCIHSKAIYILSGELVCFVGFFFLSFPSYPSKFDHLTLNTLTLVHEWAQKRPQLKSVCVCNKLGWFS